MKGYKLQEKGYKGLVSRKAPKGKKGENAKHSILI
jgi:hypothetical protein